MAHLAGIDKGPILDWTDDNGIMEHYQIWKKRVEILFRGPLNTAGDGVKCNYLIYWAGETGMYLVDKWETEGKLTDVNWNNINRYFKLFEEHISPKSNALIAIVELKRLFQGTLSLEDFHTKALWLVKEAKYPKGDIRNWVLRDTIISGLASDKIHAKGIKEGEDVTLARVMEIARLEVSMQWHLDWMQETAKVNYVKYRRGSKATGKSKPKPSGSNGSSSGSQPKTGNTNKTSKPAMKGGKWSYPTTSVGEWETPASETNVLQGPRSGMQRMQHQGTLQKGMHEEVCTPGRHSWQLRPWVLQWIGRSSIHTDAHGKHQSGGKEETPYPVPNQRWPTESEETGKDALSYCSTEGWHRSRCKPLNSSTFDKAIGDRSILQPSSTMNGSIWEFHGIRTWKVPCIPEMEEPSLQAIVLHHISKCITQPVVPRQLLHAWSAETLLLHWNLKEIQHPDSGASSKAATMYDQWWKWQGAAANFHKTFNLKGLTQRSTTEKRGYPWNLYRCIHRNWEISWPSI